MSRYLHEPYTNGSYHSVMIKKRSTIGISLLVCTILGLYSISLTLRARLGENEAVRELSNTVEAAKEAQRKSSTVVPGKSPRLGSDGFSLRKSTIEDVLMLNAEPNLVCDKLAYVRVPKTGSSSLSYNIFMRLNRVGKECNSSLYRLPKEENNVSYTVTEDILSWSLQSHHKIFVGHMAYTTGLADVMRADDGYKLTSIRAPYDRYISWLNYEMARGRNMSTSTSFSQLNYISRMKSNSTEFANVTRVHEMVTWALSDFDTIVVSEKFDVALAILMHDLKWRLGDLLSVAINARPPSQSSLNLRAIFSNVSEEIKAVFDADEYLYKMASAELDRRFDLLPELYQQVPAVLDLLRSHMAEVCQTSSTSQVHSSKQSKCMQEIRNKVMDRPREIVKEALAYKGTKIHTVVRKHSGGEDVTRYVGFTQG